MATHTIYKCILESEYLEWLNNTPVLSYKNGQVWFTESSMKNFIMHFKAQIEEKNNVSIDDGEELENLFFDLFIKESSKERGIIGSYSVSLSKKDVFGIILAIASLIDVFVSGTIARSIIISGGSFLYSLKSLVNKLSKDELQLIGTIALLQQKTSTKITADILVNNYNEYTMDYVLNKLHSLLTKDAIEWDGTIASEITIKKWL